MKAAVAMKAMKAKKVSIVARGKLAKVQVLRGTKQHTAGGLKASDLVKNKHGRVVSKKMHALSKKRAAGGWIAACNAARKALGIKGFCAIKKGSPLYVKAKALYKK